MKISLSLLYDNSFAVIAPRVWNTLPGHLHQLADMQNFLNKLTDYLNSIPDNPPVRGYSCVNGNSLLDWKLVRNGEYNIARVVGVYALCNDPVEALRIYLKYLK